MMGQLILKELRLQRSAILGAVAIAVCFYLGLWPGTIFTTWRYYQGETWASYLLGTAAYAMLTTTVMAAAFGGATAPLERRERWGDFAEMLPVERWRTVVVRLLTGVGLTLVALAFHGLVQSAMLLYLADETRYMSQRVHLPRQVDGVWAGSAAVSVAMFGIAWLLGSILRSPALSAAIAIGVVLIGLVITLTIASYVNTRSDESFVHTYLTGATLVGLAAVVVGTWISLRRVEP